MRVDVIWVRDADESVEVKIGTAHGDFWAQWIGTAPIVGNSYDVELEFDETFVWGKNISATTQEKATLRLKGEQGTMVAKIVSTEKGECLIIGIGTDLVILEVENRPNLFPNFVELRYSRLRLFPYTL